MIGLYSKSYNSCLRNKPDRSDSIHLVLRAITPCALGTVKVSAAAGIGILLCSLTQGF